MCRTRVSCRDEATTHVEAGHVRYVQVVTITPIGLDSRSRLSLLQRLKQSFGRWRTATALGSTALLCEVGARVGLPGVDGDRITAILQTGQTGLLRLYDFLVGGGVSRAAVLALGAMPYFQARIFIALARIAFPGMKRVTDDPIVQRKAVRITTAAMALIQSYGFARFLQNVPGVVTDPGPAFVARTMLIITGGAMAVGWLAETIGRLNSPPEDRSHDDSLTIEAAQHHDPTVGQRDVPMLGTGPFAPIPLQREEERVTATPSRVP